MCYGYPADIIEITMPKHGLALLFGLAPWFMSAAPPIQLSVDASDIARRIVHARETMSVSPGTLRLAYPKWIPGEHAPSGPVTDVVGLKITGGGKTLVWRRDPVELYIIAVDVPPGVTSIEVSFDFLSPADVAGGFSSGSSATSQLGMMSWNQVLMYPAGTPSDQLDLQPTLKVPRGWRYGTALPIARESGETIEFQPASLTTVVDSPVLMGANFKTIDLSPGQSPPHYLNIAADSPAALEASQDKIDKLINLVKESGSMYGSRHYRDYHFLLTLSDRVAHFGLEHHESSDDRIAEKALTDDTLWRAQGALMPHEMTHSWNGKFRRPAGLATGDFEKPMDGALLWVYEGLTNYLGEVLAARSGIWTAEQYRQNLADEAAALDDTPGRNWRPLSDTATAAQLLYGSRADGESSRRSVDYYPEGSLIWLEADTLIRRESRGQRSLDTFIQSFYGGPGGKPDLKPYTADELYAALNAVQPYDWRGFFEQRIYKIQTRAPLGGIAAGGWRLVFKNQPSEMFKSGETAHKGVNVRYSAGLVLSDQGDVLDVIPGSPADRSGMVAGAKVLAANGRQFSAETIRAAIKDAKGGATPIELITKDGDIYKTFRLDCYTGERYPDLERDATQPDLLSDIARAHAK